MIGKCNNHDDGWKFNSQILVVIGTESDCIGFVLIMISMMSIISTRKENR